MLGVEYDVSREYFITDITSGPKRFPMGNVYFVSKWGLDTNDGTSWAKSVLTIDYAIALCTLYNDYIFVAPGAYDENTAAVGVSINKSSVHLIGAGNGQTTVENSNGGAAYVFVIGGNDIEITGFKIIEATATVEGIYSDGSTYHTWIHDNIFDGAMENGMQLRSNSYSVIENNTFNQIVNDAIEFIDWSSYNIIRNNYIIGPGDYGINLNGNTVDYNFVYGNIINGQGGTTNVGINIAAGDHNFISDNRVSQCGTSSFADTGSNNVSVNNSWDEWQVQTPVDVDDTTVGTTVGTVFEKGTVGALNKAIHIRNVHVRINGLGSNTWIKTKLYVDIDQSTAGGTHLDDEDVTKTATGAYCIYTDITSSYIKITVEGDNGADDGDVEVLIFWDNAE